MDFQVRPEQQEGKRTDLEVHPTGACHAMLKELEQPFGPGLVRIDFR